MNSNFPVEHYLKPLKLTDYHCHLGGSVSGNVLWQIAHEQGLRLPRHVKDYWDFMKHISVMENEEHQTYLNRFKLTHGIQSSPYAVEKSVFHAISDAYRTTNITQIELRFNPIYRTHDQMYDMDAVIMSALIGMKRACMIYPVKAGLILETDLAFDEEKSVIIAKKAVKFKSEGIIGIDASGRYPKNFTFKPFKKAYKIAQDAGLKTTVHAGEVLGPDNIWEAITELNPDRIGHGVKCINDKALMKVLTDKNIVLELCPTSNLRLGVIKDIDELDHTINTLISNDVKFCINTDGPEFLRTSVYDELLLLYNNKIMNAEQIEKLVDDSKGYTFISK